MSISIQDLKSFYNNRLGHTAQRVINARINEIWDGCKGMRVMGCGYTIPYLRNLMTESERSVAIIPADYGAQQWPVGKNALNLVALSSQYDLPIETNSIDRAIIIHNLEHSDHLNDNLAEIWRVLKSSGRLIVIVPNRSGFWARTDKNPFGQGRPFSTSQICKLLKDNKFVHERTEEALFMPPISYGWVMRLADTFERIGQTAFPLLSGVHIIEVSKQLYARADKGSGSAIVTKAKHGLMPKPVVSNRKY